VVKLADARESESWVPQGACGFDPRPRHSTKTIKRSIVEEVAGRSAPRPLRASVGLADDPPHDVLVNAEVVVHDLVAHADDVCPSDLRVAITELPGDLMCSLTNDLNEMNQSEAKVLVGIVRLARKARVLVTAFLAMSSMCPA
jgi:hypothetical protein